MPIVLRSGSLNLLELYGPVQACKGIVCVILNTRSIGRKFLKDEVHLSVEEAGNFY